MKIEYNVQDHYVGNIFATYALVTTETSKLFKNLIYRKSANYDEIMQVLESHILC